jgi:dolichyl-phosphate-mannose-protein mannosyltransferase
MGRKRANGHSLRLDGRDMFKLNLSVRDIYDRLFLILFVVDIVLRVIWLDRPAGWLIFDENFYVNAARVILGSSSFRGRVVVYGVDPTPYHPPLAKLLITLSMFLIGDNGYGWRLPSAIFGSVAVLLFYLFLKKAENKKTALIGTFLFSFDTLIFVMSRVAMLDIFTLTFMLLGFYLYFSGRPYLSAVSMALSTLTKLPGASGFAVVAIVEAIRFFQNRPAQRSWGSLVRWMGKYVATYVSFFLLALAVLDYFYVGSANILRPFTFAYAQAVLRPIPVSCPRGDFISCPWQWLINQVPIGFSVFSFDLKFAMNPEILFFAVPAILYSAYRYLRGRSLFGLFNVVWFLVTYLPYFPPAIFTHTQTFIFYFVLTMPAVCGAIAYAIVDNRLPRVVILAYLYAVLVYFFLMFPFKAIPT